MLRKAFTLMEVNLAILIMAGGVLSVVSLFALGYRENRQSREDVAAAAYADAVLSPLIMACSAGATTSTARRASSRATPRARPSQPSTRSCRR